MKSPLDISYNDLIKEAERELQLMDQKYPALVSQGSLSAWTANHRIAAKKALVRLLKRHKKDPQLNLNDLFEK